MRRFSARAWMTSTALVAPLLLACGGRAVDDRPADASVAADAAARDAGEAEADAATFDAGADGRALDASCPSGDGSPILGALGREPLQHRSTPGVACPSTRVAETPVAACRCPADAGLGTSILEPDGGLCVCSPCSEDSDCTAGMNGRCAAVGPDSYLTCTYDACVTDEDCASGGTCVCRPSAESTTPNVCLPGNCRVDSDCGPGGYCSPSLVGAFCQCQGSAALCAEQGTPCDNCSCGDGCGHGNYCHTACDTCIDDSDCPEGTCNYDILDGVWSCSECWPIP